MLSPSLAAKLAEIEREEQEWEKERAEIIAEISRLQGICDEWPEIRNALSQQLHDLEQEMWKEPPECGITSSASFEFSEPPSEIPAPIPAPEPRTEKTTHKTRGKKKRGGKSAAPERAPEPSPAPASTTDEIPLDYSLKATTLVHHIDAVRSLAFHTTLPYLATGSDDGTIRITNLEPPKRPKARKAPTPTQFTSMRGHSGPVLTMAASHNRLYSGDVNGKLCIWNFVETKSTLFDTRGRCNHDIIFEGDMHRDAIWSIAVHENADFLVTASADGTSLAFDRQSFNTTKLALDDTPILAAFNSDGSEFVIACTSGKLRIFTSSDKAERAVIECGSYVFSMAPGSSPSHLFVATEDKTVKLYDLSTGDIVDEFVAHASPTTGLAVLNGGDFLATTSADASVRIWRTKGFSNVYAETLHREKYGESGLCLAATPLTSTHKYFASGGADGSVRFFGA